METGGLMLIVIILVVVFIAGKRIENKLKLLNEGFNFEFLEYQNKIDELNLKIQELEAAKIAQEQIIKNIETTYESKLKEAESRMYISQIAGSQQLTNDLRNVMPGLMLHLQTNYQISWNEKSQTVEFLTKSGSVVLDDSLRNMKSEDIILDALKKTKFIKVNQTAGGNTGGGSRLNLDKINQPLNNNNNQPDHRIPNLTKAEQHLANMVKGYGNN